MKAQAPGKLVLSGAYSVLEGAPALVAAVDRYVIADDAAPVNFETLEVLEAVARGYLPRPVGFDASALRDNDKKLGLGSSAAILVASMAVSAAGPDATLAQSLFRPAFTAHRAAQGGGSGIDVAAACFGAVLRCEIGGDELATAAHALPGELAITVWSCPTAASTKDMLSRVRAYAGRDPTGYRAIMDRATSWAVAAADAEGCAAFIEAIEQQRRALDQLGMAAGVPIVTSDVRALAEIAHALGATFAPSGAGGGDVALLFAPTSAAQNLAEFRARAEASGLVHVPMKVGAPGVSRLTPKRAGASR